MFHRVTGTRQMSCIGNSDKKRESLLRSLKRHVQLLRSLEESERVRKACLAYLQSWYGAFERGESIRELDALAAELQGNLERPPLRWKYGWIRPVLGSRTAKWAQSALPQIKTFWLRRWDKIMYLLESGRHPSGVRTCD